MSEPVKISIRFFNDREVRAVWDDADAKWWFSVLDVVAVLNEENDYQRVRNYWKYLKAKLKKENNQLVSATTQLKIIAPDRKKRLADLLDSEGVTALAKHFPNNKSMKFLDCVAGVVFCDNPIGNTILGAMEPHAHDKFIPELVEKKQVSNVATVVRTQP